MAHCSIFQSLKNGRGRRGLACLSILMSVASLAVGSGLTPTRITQAAWAGPDWLVREEAAGSIYYVDADSSAASPTGLSWSEAFRNLQEGLVAAGPGDQIWVAEGVYTPTQRLEPDDPRSATFRLSPGVGLYGGFDPDLGVTEFEQREWEVYASVLSGDLEGDDAGLPDEETEGAVRAFASADGIVGGNAYHVVSSENISETARLDGFTIQGGQACEVSGPESGGGGMYNLNSYPSLRNLLIIGNMATNGGGMNNDHSNPGLVNVVFVANKAGTGGGMYNSSSRPKLMNVQMNGNLATNGGGIANFYSSPNLMNATLTGNVADYGGAIFDYSSGLRLVNATLSANQANKIGGGIFSLYYSNSQVYNSILWNNAALISGYQAYDDGTSMTIFSYSLAEGSGGSGILDADPSFMRDPNPGDGDWSTTTDNDYGDLRLDDASPAIDGGDNSRVPRDDFDLDGDDDLDERVPLDMGMAARFVDHLRPDAGLPDLPAYPFVVDMGAYETMRPQEWTLYQHDFESDVGTEWDCTTIHQAVTPTGRGFLGHFSNQDVCLTFSGQSPHEGVRISFDLFIISSWNGNVHSTEEGIEPDLATEESFMQAVEAIVGPDCWGMKADGKTLLYTTFANVLKHNQAYPEWYPGGDYLRFSGAAEINSLGYYWVNQPLDAVYHFNFLIPHNAPDLQIDFYARGLQHISNESWGLDNVQVNLLSELWQVYLPVVAR